MPGGFPGGDSRGVPSSPSRGITVTAAIDARSAELAPDLAFRFGSRRRLTWLVGGARNSPRILPSGLVGRGRAAGEGLPGKEGRRRWGKEGRHWQVRLLPGKEELEGKEVLAARVRGGRRERGHGDAVDALVPPLRYSRDKPWASNN